MTNSNSKFFGKPAITTDFCVGVDVDQKLRLAAKYGFGSVMLNMNLEKGQPTASQQALLCKRYNLQICCVHLPFDMQEHTINANKIWQDEHIYFDYITQSLDFCGKFDIPIAVFHLTSGKVFPPPSEIGLERVERLLEVAKKNGVLLALENKRATNHNAYVFEHITSDNLAFCYDTGHENVFQPNANMTGHMTAKYPMVMIHLHDNDGKRDQHQLPFDGTVDFQTVKQNLVAANYQNNLMLECRKELSQTYRQMTVEQFVERAYQSAVKFQNLF